MRLVAPWWIALLAASLAVGCDDEAGAPGSSAAPDGGADAPILDAPTSDGDAGVDAAHAPEAPTSAPSLVPGDSTLAVAWGSVASATSYEVHLAESSDLATAKLAATTSDTSCTLAGLVNGTTYYVAIKAKNAAGTSALGPSAGATPMAPARWPSGVLQRGSDGDERAVGMQIDAAGYVYVAGYSNGNLDPSMATYQGGDDAYLVRYDARGTRGWTEMVGSIEERGFAQNDRANALALDGAGGVYVTGVTRGNLGSDVNVNDTDVMFVARVSTGGAREWVKLYELAGSVGRGIAARDGGVYTTGSSCVDGLCYDFVAKHDSAGVVQWIRRGEAGGDALGVALDPGGDVFVTGSAASGAMVVRRHDHDGNVVWKTEAPGYLVGRALVVDESSNSWVTGSTQRGQAFVAKYDAGGAEVWAREIVGTLTAGASAIARDAAGALYVTGGVRGDLDGVANADASGATYDMFVTKFDASGARVWTRMLGSSAYDAGIAVAVLDDGSVLVHGHTQGVLATPNGGAQDYFFVRYDASGAML